jgi:photosystem II protein PsbQ
MPSLRSILSVILVLVTTLLVSCSSPQASKIPTTYSPEKIAQLQVFAEPITAAREEILELQDLLAAQNWVDTRTLIHGPLGQLRRDMLNLSRSLLPKDQKQAAGLAREVFGHLEALDAAAKERNSAQAETQFRQALLDFDAFLEMIPRA